jgi:hypothetical protein
MPVIFSPEISPTSASSVFRACLEICNNAAERALKPTVMGCRGTSGGSGCDGVLHMRD